MPTVTEKLEKAITNGQMRMKVRTGTKVAFVIMIALFLGILALIIFKVSMGQFDIAPGLIGLPAFLYGIYANPVTMKQSDLFFLTDHKITNYFLEWLMTYDLKSHPK